MGKPQILLDRCVRSLSRMVGCRACEQSCPKAAIVLRETPFQLFVNEKCDGCGLCWTKCPAEAVLPPPEGRDCAQPELGVICQKANGDRAEMPKGGVLRVPCVKEIGFRFLAARWMTGLRRLVVYGADCSGCSIVPPPSREDGVRRVNEILRVAGQGSIDVVSGEPLGQSEGRAGAATSEGAHRATSRRGLLKAMITGSLDAAFPSTRDEPGTREETGASVAFLEALDGLGNGEELKREGRLAAYRLGVDARVCYGCKVCATLCPTGALSWQEDPESPDSARLRVDPSRCHGCGVCLDLCDVGAVDCEFRPDLRVQQEILFREGRCSVCDRIFLATQPGEGLCPGCRSHDRNLSPMRVSDSVKKAGGVSRQRATYDPMKKMGRSAMKIPVLLFCVFLSLSVCQAQQGNAQVLAAEEGGQSEGTRNDCVMFSKRFSEVVLIPGRRLEGLLGQPIAGIRLMVWKGGRWEPVPFQVDEKDEKGNFLFPFGGENDQERLDQKLAPWDEVVFMARDAGCRGVPLDGPPGHTKVEEIQITDPLTGEKGWLYLCSFLEPPPLSTVDLIAYDPDYDRVNSRYYAVGYSRVKHDQKAVMEYYSVPPESGGTGVNWFDSAKIWTRIRLFFSLFQITIHSDDWDSWVPAYIDGPIRVIVKKRMHIKIGLGLHTPNVDADLVYYPHFFMSAIVIGIPFDPSIVTSSLEISIGTDLNHLATGILFWNSENLDPVIVDGRMSPQEEAMDMRPDRWRVVSGAQGKYMGKAVYGGNFKLSNIKLNEGRYIDDYTLREPPENEPGIFGSYNWTWDITNGKKGKYVVWMEAHYGPPIESEEDLKCCLDVTDNPLLLRVGPEERLNCLLIQPPGFTEDVLPAIFRKDVEVGQMKGAPEEPEVVPERTRKKRGKGYGTKDQP